MYNVAKLFHHPNHELILFYRSYVLGKPFSPASLVDLCLIIVGSLATSESTPCINKLIEQAHKKIDKWTGPLLVPTARCRFFKQGRLCVRKETFSERILQN